MTDKSKGDRPPAEDETSLLLEDGPEVSQSESEEPFETPIRRTFIERVLDPFFLLEAFALLNYVVAIMNIFYIALLYLRIYTPEAFRRFAHECAPKIEMSVFLDLVLSIATVLLFSSILRYLRQVG